ncbi:LamG domain-containing protein [Hymenobacter sp. BRD67]|uniref:LamG domain-containing protein n=1 Tax=Hymenobacter sp. BRD67 TaxID=2675877 RepID=UPI001565D73F|nr:LamG domain-containing protein [Hymenobacter sp. BRD67]QKG54357.1 LamG domain-containing protein [Hymenobacter sp. BRD67]
MPPPTNNALAFDGNDDYVALGSPASLSNLGVSGCTLETWVNLNSTGVVNSLIRKDGDYTLAVLNGTPYVEVWNQGTGSSARTYVSGTTNLTAGRWQHLAATWNGTTLRLYLDGVDVSGTQAASPVTASSQLQLGRSVNYNQPLGGQLDELRIYNVALTQAQVQADQFSTTAAVPASQKYYANFDQGAAGGNNAGITSLTDQSGNGNTGTLNNFALTGTTSNFVRSFPTITGIAPATGGIGTSVALTGTNLTDAAGFAFNGTSTTGFATPTSDLTATVTVPTGATTGPVSVASATLAKYNGPTFTVTYPDLVVSTFMQLTPGIYNNVTITNGGGGYFSAAGQLFQVMGKMVVQPGGFFSGNGTLVTGPGSFALSRRAEMNVTTATGLSTSGPTGDIQVTGTRYFSPDATYNYSSYNSSAQITGSGLPARVNTFRNYNQNSVTFTNSLAIRNVLVYYNGTPPTRPAGITLTLLSDQDSTASIQYAGTAYPGSYIVQRYVSGDLNPGAGYRQVSAPVAGPMVSDLATAAFTPVVNPAYNTSATPGTTTPFPTVYGYDETRLATTTNNLSAFDKGFFSPAALSTVLADGRATP